MNVTNFCNTLGVLDHYSISGNRLSVAGWVLSLEADPITELRLSFGDVSVGSSVDHRLNSMDVHAAWPTIRNSKNCRFSIEMELGAEHSQRVAGGLISITPYVGSTPGIPIERFWPTILSATPVEESDVVGRGDFIETSFSFLTLFRLVASLRRDDSVLDAGCGIGRMAFALSHYLGNTGSYCGFDVSKDFVDLAKVRYRHKENFSFQHIDIFNKMYNPTGQLHAANFVFPFPDRSFSFVFLTSVFTHMLTADVENYLREIRRVLDCGGRCFATFFVIDEEAERLIAGERSSLALRHLLSDGCIAENTEVPENAVGYRETHLKMMVASAGMKISKLHRGLWPGRTHCLTYQDICLLEAV